MRLANPIAFWRAGRSFPRLKEPSRQPPAIEIGAVLKITAHDGLLNSGHPVIEAAITRAHSATSLRRMLTDPLGFVWGYALGWKPPSPLSQEEPLALDNPTYGILVHELLRRDGRIPRIKRRVRGCHAEAGRVSPGGSCPAESRSTGN